jgi:hypothetical protein
VHAVQTWKPGALRILGHPIGKYRQQYTFTCPRSHATVEPYVMAAAAFGPVCVAEAERGEVPGLSAASSPHARSRPPGAHHFRRFD